MKKPFSSLPLALAIAAMGICAASCHRAEARRFASSMAQAAFSKAADANGDTEYVTKNYPLSGYSSVNASAGVAVVYTASADGSCSVRAEIAKEMLPYFKAKSSGGRLMLYVDKPNGFNFSGTPAKVYVSGPALRSAVFSSGASLSLSGTGAVRNHFTLSASSGAAAKLEDMACADLTISVSSGASTRMSRLTCAGLALSASSGASAKAETLKAAGVSVSASSGASASLSGVSCTSMKAEASSAGQCTLSGSCSGRAVYKKSSGGRVNVEKFAVKREMWSEDSELESEDFGGSSTPIVSGSARRAM